MHNDPELNGKYLGTITKDFAAVADLLKEASYQVRRRRVSDFPIFIFTRSTSPAGALLFGSRELNLQWNIYASYLEDFMQRRIIHPDKADDFKAAYKNPDEFCCLCVIDDEFTNFVFVPFPED